MSVLSVLGAGLLSAATVPQAWRLLRRRSARDFAWPFVALNLVGLLCLAARSGEIEEWSFFAVNLLAAAFWLLVLAVKAMEHAAGPRAPPPLGVP